MSVKTIIFWLSLLFLLTEVIVSVVMAQLGVGTEDVWQIVLWDVTADTLIIVPAICFWLYWKRGTTPSQLLTVAVKTTLIIVLVEGGTEHLLQTQPLPYTAWQTILADALIFAIITAPAVYYLALCPLFRQQRPTAQSLPVPVCIALSILISFSVFIFDISLPLGVAGGVPYVALILVGLWFPQRSAAIVLAFVGTVLTIIGYLISEDMGIPWMVMTNRGLAIFAIWVTAILVVRHKGDIAELNLAAVVFKEAAGGITVTDANNNIIAINPAFEKITGYSQEDVVGRNPRTLQSGRHDKDFYRNMWHALHRTGSWHGEIWNRNKAGQIYPETLSLAVLKDINGHIINHIALFQDISEQKKVEAQLKKKTEIMQLLHAISTSANTVQTMDDALRAGLSAICEYTDWPIGHVYLLEPKAKDRLIPSNIWYLKDEATYAPFIEATMDAEFEIGAGLPGRVLASGHNAWIDDVRKDPNFHRAQVAADVGVKTGFGVPVLAGEDVVAVMSFYASDIVEPDKELLQVLDDIGKQLGRVFEREKAEEQLRHLANHDGLTGLPTARLGMDRLTGALAMARRNRSMAALMFIDLDGFKAVNDTFGHEAGDQLLKGVSERLSSCVREVDTVARIGGDEFMIVLGNIGNRAGAEKVAQSVIDAVSQPFKLHEHVATVGASIGIALYPEHGEQPEVILKRADEAMYAVKRTGKNNYQFAAE